MSEFKNPKILAMNIIRYIGDHVSETGKPIPKLFGVPKQVGAPSEQIASEVIEELYERGLIRGKSAGTMAGKFYMNLNLSLEGWEQYEAEKRGEFKGNYGFIAMQFNDPTLDPFVKNIVKPVVKEDLGYDLVDMRDITRAGVIDNIMRAQIRDAAFVIVDLTHDNPGAYWEAGYAEGLGKPVIYLCEKEKFEAQKTHFDTNHCTTIPWCKVDHEEFRQKLIATIRRSLSL